jgi:hypothetical protein
VSIINRCGCGNIQRGVGKCIFQNCRRFCVLIYSGCDGTCVCVNYRDANVVIHSVVDGKCVCVKYSET